MNILEILIDKYYGYSNAILGSCCLIGAVAMVVGTCLLRNKEKIIGNILNNLYIVIGCMCIGRLIYLLGMLPEVQYVYFNMLIFVMSISMVILHAIVQFFLHKKIKNFLWQICKNMKYILLLQMLILTARGNLQGIEFFTAIIGILCSEVFIKYLEREEYQEEEIKEEYDYPTIHIYPTRKKQLKKFKEILAYQKNEPYAIMISGEWGMGKTSFVKALEDEMSGDIFLWIRAGSEKSVSEIMLEISEQVLEILQNEGIIIEREGLIEKYFLAFSGLLDEAGMSFINKMVNIFDRRKNEDSKEYLNTKLKCLNKTIYLIIDDLDRCSKEYQIKMFKVIRESTELEHCKTIFLVDRTQFLGFDEKYIEKYISYTLELCEVSSKEMFDELFDEIIPNNFIKEMDNILLKSRDSETVRRMICRYPDNMLYIFGEEISKIERAIRYNKEDDTKVEREKIADYTRNIYEIRKNIINSRKLKNYLKGIKRDIININKDIRYCSAEFQQEDWLDTIIKVHFLKCFLPEIYSEIKLCIDIYEFGEKYKGHSEDILLGVRYGFSFLEEKKELMLNHIIYDVDVIDFEQLMTEQEKYLKELYEAASIENIEEYVKYAKTYDDFNKILETCERQVFEDYDDRQNFINALLTSMSKEARMLRDSRQKFYELSLKVIGYLKSINMTEKEKNICERESRLIVRRIIVDNTHLLRTILLLLFEVTDVENKWQALSVSNIEEFYLLLKRIDFTPCYEGLENEENKLLGIYTYYKNLLAELRKDKYDKVGIDFSEIHAIFETCLLWENIESVLDVLTEDELTVREYFDLENGYLNEKVIFNSADSLKNAIKALGKFYQINATAYDSNFSLLLLRLAHQMVLISEADVEWLKESKREIADLLIMVAEQCYLLDRCEGTFARNAIDEIRAFVYKFDCFATQI